MKSLFLQISSLLTENLKSLLNLNFLLKDGLLTWVYVGFIRGPLDLEPKEYRSYLYLNHLIFKFNILKFSEMISI